MNWRVIITASAEKQLKRLPEKMRMRVRGILVEMTRNPFGGDVQKLQGTGDMWRRRFSAYRIVYEVDISAKSVFVYYVIRRSSHTY